MITLINESKDPYFNLALEEYLLKEYPLKDDIFFVWRNTPSVVIGRNQNPYNEVDLEYCHNHQIPVLRRISGGGTVYHDLGNVNFTYVSNNAKYINDYKFFLQPIISLLNQIGLDVEFVPKSHIYLGKQKISGNAQASYKSRMLHHGTILYDINKEKAGNCLKIKYLDGHHVLSVPASICNLKDKIPVITDIDSFMDYIRDGVLMYPAENRLLELNEADYKRIQEISNTKFKTFEWNYGTNSSFYVKNDVIEIKVQNGIIMESSIEGLRGLKLEYDKIEEVLDQFDNKKEILRSIF